MEEGRKHIDDLFREGLEGYREMPDAAVWTSIEQRLPKRGNRRSFLWLWVLLMLALLSSLGYYANRHYFKDASEAAQEMADPKHDGSHPGNLAAEAILPNSPEDVSEDQETGHASKTQEKTLPSKTTNIADPSPVNPSSRTNHAAPDHQVAEASTHGTDDLNRNGSGKKLPASSESINTPPGNAVVNAEKPNTNKVVNDNALTGRQKSNTDQAPNQSDTKGVEMQPSGKEVATSATIGGKIAKKTEAKSPPVKAAASKAAKNNNSLPMSSRDEKIAAEPKEATTLLSKPVSPSSKKTSASSMEANKVQPHPDPQPEAKTPPSAKASTIAKTNAPLKPEKESVPTSKPSSVAQQKLPLQPQEKPKNASPVTPPSPNGNRVTANAAERKNSQPTPPETAKGKPVTVQEENAQANPVVVEKDAAAVKNVVVQAEPNKKKSKIGVSYQDAKGDPLVIEPVKEYGIKIDEAVPASSDNPSGNANSLSGGGGGSAGAGQFKNRNGLKFDGGVKAGYERGFADVTTSNFIGNLFLQWNISPRISLVVQPGLRYHSINKTNAFSQNAYHQITSASLDSAHTFLDSIGFPNYFLQRTYIYRNGYDSISVGYTLNPQKYVEVELPLLLQYKLADNLSILGGFQLAFGKIIQIQSSMQRYQLSKVDSFSLPLVEANDTTLPFPDRPGLSGYFGYNTAEISQLDENKYKNPAIYPARFGLMLGFSYELKKRLLIDLLVRKNLSGLSYIPNEQVRKIYSQPYFRVTVGYKLFRSK